MSLSRLASSLCLFFLVAPLFAEIRPGDLFREFVWRPPTTNPVPWQRVTWPGVTDERPKVFLPNETNSIRLAHLDGAQRVEVQVELLQSHSGTVDHAIRVNGNPWIPIPLSKDIPGDLGNKHVHPALWLTMRYPVVEVPLAALKQGLNSFEFNCGPGEGLGKWWPQSIIYGVVFRVYYAPDSADAPTGRVVALSEKPTREQRILLVTEAEVAKGRAIRRIDFLARYKGYDWRGEGQGDNWHYHSSFGRLQRHAGTAHVAPWGIEWDVSWVPQQEHPVDVAARIEDETGLIRMTPATTLTSYHGQANVRMFTPYEIPPHWQARDNRRYGCKLALPDDIGRAAEAKFIIANWNGLQCDEIQFNETLLARNLGFDHDLSYNELSVPVGTLRRGENTFSTLSQTLHHGIEVLWPGPVLLVRYAPEPEAH